MYTTSGHYIVFLLGNDTDWDKWATFRIDKNILSQMFEDCCANVLQQQEKLNINHQWYFIWKMRPNCHSIKSQPGLHKSVYIQSFLMHLLPYFFSISYRNNVTFLVSKTVRNILLYLIYSIYSHCADNECGCNKDDISN